VVRIVDCRVAATRWHHRSLDLAEWGDYLRFAVGDDSIAVDDSRYIAVIRDDEAIRLLQVPDGVLFVEVGRAPSRSWSPRRVRRPTRRAVRDEHRRRRHGPVVGGAPGWVIAGERRSVASP
jgi:hypothetical protein